MICFVIFIAANIGLALQTVLSTLLAHWSVMLIFFSFPELRRSAFAALRAGFWVQCCHSIDGRCSS